MVNPSLRSNPFTLGLNRKNKFELIRQYQLILNGNNVNEIENQKIVQKEEEFWNESEWTFKNTIKRVIGYGFSILFIIIGVLFMFEADIQGLIYGVLMLLFSASYIFYDVKVILEKYKKKKAKL